jgi:hypothetical protein
MFLSIMAIALAWAPAPAVLANAIDVTWTGGTEFPNYYSNASKWTPQVAPNNGNGGNTYRVTIGSGGPAVDIDAAVDVLTILSDGDFTVHGHLFRSGVTRNDGSIAVAGPVSGNNAPGKADLGRLANFNAATNTLESGSYSAGIFERDAIISFEGAKIVTNSATIRLTMGTGRITDESGNDALKFLAVNNGVLDLTTFVTAGDFTNNGELDLTHHDIFDRTFVVTGKLTNFDANTKTLTGGRYVLSGSSGHSYVTLLQFPGADIVTNAADIEVAKMLDSSATGKPSIVDENGNDALRNFAHNAAGGRILFMEPDFATMSPQVTNAGYMYLGRRYSLPQGGSFEQSGGELAISMYPTLPASLDTGGGTIHLNGGRLTGGGRLIGTTFSNAVIAPGDNTFQPLTTFQGDLTLGPASILRFDIRGLSRGPGMASKPSAPIPGYDAIDSTGNIAIGGKLQVASQIVPAAGDTFALVKASGTLTGSFANVANGARLVTVDGGGSFVVNYGPNSAFDPKTVVLSNFQANTRPAVLLNISTRGIVEGGQRVLIGGFIVTGSEPKPVLLRALGPSLVNFGVANALKNPTLTLHNNTGATIASNDDWQQSAQWTDVQGTGIPPSDAREAAMVATLPPGNYTAVVEGKDGANGVALVEIYDLDASTQSQLANISTRGYAGTGDNALIGGMIVGGGTGNTDVVVRGLGPSLAGAGVTEPLSDPYLYIKNQAGNAIDSNDNWTDNRAAIEATGIPPSNDREAAIARTLQPGAYTAIVQPSSANGIQSTSGIGLVEFYRLR